MSEFKLVLIGFGLVGIGIFSVIWNIVKVISCIMIAGLISTSIFHLTGYYWWFSSIIIYCIIRKILFLGNTSKTYQEWIEKYQKMTSEEKEDIKDYKEV